jgi:hypothetical protein
VKVGRKIELSDAALPRALRLRPRGAEAAYATLVRACRPPISLSIRGKYITLVAQ